LAFSSRTHRVLTREGANKIVTELGGVVKKILEIISNFFKQLHYLIAENIIILKNIFFK
jgi:hypothetical protein